MPPAASTNRAERFFARIGVAAMGLAFVVVVIAIDIAVTKDVRPLTRDSGEDAVDLVTARGRELGWAASGMRLVHTPLTLYENLPNQALECCRINSMGLRDPEISATPDGARVIVVGGSAAFGFGVGDSDTLSSALGQLNRSVEVLNAGVIGYLTSQELALVLHKLIDLQPSLIIAFNGWNDLFDVFWWERFGDGETKHRDVNVIFNDVEARLLKYREIEWNPSYAMREAGLSIIRNSTLLAALYRGLRGAGTDDRRALSPLEAERRVGRVAEKYVSNMKKLRDVARAAGGSLLVVLQPEEGQLLEADELGDRSRGEKSAAPGAWYWSAFPASYREFRNRVVPALEKAGIYVIDGTLLLADQLSTDRLFQDMVHPTPAGYALIAQRIHAPVRELLGDRPPQQ